MDYQISSYTRIWIAIYADIYVCLVLKILYSWSG
jgi:hypothetical protein